MFTDDDNGSNNDVDINSNDAVILVLRVIMQ